MFYISRFKDVERREYDFEVVTPLFLGGADAKKAELRAPSIKAVMRFWWRAQYETDNVEEMAKKEAEIFGSTEKKSVVSVQLSADMTKTVPTDLPKGWPIPVEGKTFNAYIIEYLAFGMLDTKLKTNKYIKEHIEEKSRFKIVASFPKNVENDVIKALKALISFGGLGARSRNGFGSLHCNGLVDHTINNEGTWKSFTAFSQGAILFNQFKVHDKWEDALSEIGKVYRQARLDLEGRRHVWDKRALIAMPIEAQREDIPARIKSGRHAKPYFLHVNKTHDEKYQGHILFLPYLYKAGPNDSLNMLREYKEVCGIMNDEILKGMGGKK